MAVLAVCIVCNYRLNAQLISGEIFMPGHYLEIGQTTYGAFGATSGAPAGYHPNDGSGGSNLAEVYDINHDGWTVGAPPLMGDYTYPGSPFEGWAIQVGGPAQLNWACQGTGGISGTGTLTGSNVSYSNAGGTILGNWAGTCGPGGQLSLKTETRVDTNASWVVVTTKMYNTGATALNNIYFMRTCDPDNDEADGGSFSTNNSIPYQNDVDHRVMVKAMGTVYTNAYLGLGTKDQRAKALIYSDWPITYYVTDLSTVYTGTASIAPFYTLHGSDNGDIAIGLVYYICSIAPHDSDYISYAYTFLNTDAGIDSAFPEPHLVVNDSVINPPTAPGATYDTFDACAHPGMTSVNVNLGGATTGVWTWSTWTWGPSTGLSATSGTSVTINLLLVPGEITYTITGTDSLPGHTCTPGGKRTMYLTIKTCNSIYATVNYPCQGDSIHLVCHSDSAGSVGATYSWTQITGTGGFTSTLQNPSIYPAEYIDTGTYRVIRHNSSGNDTATIRVIIHPKPIFAVTNNGDSLCSSFGTLDTLKLYASPSIGYYTYAWGGPGAYTAGVPHAIRVPYNLYDVGWYSVRVTDTFGCWDTGGTYATIIPPIVPPTITGLHHYCTGDPFVPFGITLQPGASAEWYPDSVGGVGSTTPPVINTSYAHTVIVYASQIEGICEGLRDSFKVVVDSTPPPPVVTNNTPICADSVLHIYGSDGLLVPMHYQWSGPLGFASSVDSPTIANAQTSNSGTYTLLVTVDSSTCHNTASTVVVVDPTPGRPVLSSNTPCNTGVDIGTINLNASASGTSAVYHWSGPAGFVSLGASPSISPAILGTNDGVYTVVATITTGTTVCPSLPDTLRVKIYPYPNPPKTYDTAFCQFSAPIPVRADSALDSSTGVPDHLVWYTNSTGTAVVSAPVVPTTQYVSPQMWYVRQVDDHGCRSYIAPVTVNTLDSPVFNIVTSNTFVCQDSTLIIAYDGMAYAGISYRWTLPSGTFIRGGSLDSGSLIVQFDSVHFDSVSLLVIDHNWNISCGSKTRINVDVVPMPTVHFYGQPIACAGDTVVLALPDRSDSAHSFVWDYDFGPNDYVVTGSSNTGGPYSVCWHDGGVKNVGVIPVTIEGCRGLQTYDTVLVRERPDASFNGGNGGVVCAEDSVLFRASAGDSSAFKFHWSPEHFFHNNNSGEIWGRVEIPGYINLSVADQYGCTGYDSVYFNVESCCLVSFPTAFSPNNDTHNDCFRPLFKGEHQFDIFKIQNRWGQTVYESTNNEGKWDGSYGGVPQEIGVYYYYLKYHCGSKVIEKRGDVTLVR